VDDLGVAREQQRRGERLRDQPDGVRGDQDPLAVPPVGPDARRDREQHERQELGRRGERDVTDVTADGQHRERQGHAGDPVAEDAEHLAAEEQAVLRFITQHGREQTSHEASASRTDLPLVAGIPRPRQAASGRARPRQAVARFTRRSSAWAPSM
jgi:hypothetical protein